MLASNPIRNRRLRDLVTPTRLVTTILAALVLLVVVLPGGGHTLLLGSYLLLVLVTAIVLRGVRREPRGWLRRRALRRCLVLVMLAICVALAAGPATTGPSSWSGVFVLFLVLMVLNVALGRATQRIATAPNSTVDERQEALRNRVHRIAYAFFAVAVGGTALVADTVSPQSRSWLEGSLGAGGLIAFLELLFVLPAMVLAFLDHDTVDVSEGGVAVPQGARARWGAALLAITLAIPLVLSLGVLIAPVQVTSYQNDPTGNNAAVIQGGPAGAVTKCREFFAVDTVGVGVTAELFLHAEACWDGSKAYEVYGMNASDCLPGSSSLAIVTATLCQRTTSSDGTLSFTFRSHVASMLVPFLHRDVTLQLVVDRSGHVSQFP